MFTVSSFGRHVTDTCQSTLDWESIDMRLKVDRESIRLARSLTYKRWHFRSIVRRNIGWVFGRHSIGSCHRWRNVESDFKVLFVPDENACKLTVETAWGPVSIEGSIILHSILRKKTWDHMRGMKGWGRGGGGGEEGEGVCKQGVRSSLCVRSTVLFCCQISHVVGYWEN